MPPLPRKPRRTPPAQALAALSDDLRRDLEDGHSFFESYETKEDMAAAWAAVGKELLAEYIAQHPGRRPFAWWLCEHKQERPLNTDRANFKEMPWVRQQARFGFVHTSIWYGDGRPYQQDETEYLEDHGLLTDDELRRIPVAEDYPAEMDLGEKIRAIMWRGPRLKRKEI